MRVKYIHHSGFYLPLRDCELLFDFYRADLPEEIDGSRPLYVFCSHSHRDHCDMEVLVQLEGHPNLTFIMAAEILHGEEPFLAPSWMRERIIWLEAGEKRKIGPLEVETLESTDCGVAFIVRAEGRTIYHAGDLNDWYWAAPTPEDAAWVAAMTANYNRIIEPLRGRRFDVAFVPVDPRLEQPYRGLDELLERVEIRWLFPMHQWQKYSTARRWLETEAGRRFKGRMSLPDGHDQWFENEEV